MNKALSYKPIIRSAILVLVLLYANMTKGQICVERADKIPVTGKDILYCNGKSLTLSAKLCNPSSGSISYLWTYLNDPYIYTKNSKFIVPDTGFYEIVITSADGFITKDTFHLKYYPKSNFEINTNPLPLKCEGIPLTLRATKNSTFTNYKWYSIFDTLSLSQADTLFDAQNGYVYIAKATDANKCVVSDTIEVVESPFVPKVDLGAKDTVLCEGNVVSLKNLLPSAGDIKWSTGETSESISVFTSAKIWLRVTNTFRCAATDTINVKVVPAPEITDSPTFYACAKTGVKLNIPISGNADLYSYEWTPNVTIDNNKAKNPTVKPAVDTRYFVKVYTSAGCQDNGFVNVVINPIVKSLPLFTDTAVCVGKEIMLLGSGAGGTPETSSSFPYSFEWSSGTGTFISADPKIFIKPKESGSYLFKVTDAKGCSETDTVHVKTSQFSVTINNSKNEICLGDSFQVKTVVNGGISPYSYLWNTAFPFISDKVIPEPWVNPNASGTKNIKVDVIDKAGCMGSDSFTLKTYSKPLLTNLPETMRLCVGDTMELNLNPGQGSGSGYQFTWIPFTENINNANSINPSVAGIKGTLGERKFNIKITDSKGCNNISDTLKITTLDSPEIKLSVKDTTLCIGEKVILSSVNLFNKNFGFSWQNRDGVEISTDSVLKVDAAGVYYLSVVNENRECSSSDSVTIKTTSSPTIPTIVYNLDNCAYEEILLKACSEGENIVYQWKNNVDENLNSDASGILKYKNTDNEEKAITFRVIASNLCGFSDSSITLLIHPVPVININSVSDKIYKDSSVTLYSSSLNSNYIYWKFGEEQVIKADTVNHIFTREGKNLVYLKASNNFGCHAYDTLEFDIFMGELIKELFVPNIFSPLSSNKDNQSFRIFGKNISSDGFSLQVYNKWGELVFQTNLLEEAMDQGWNASSDAHMSIGIYTYTLAGYFNDGEKFKKTGTVTLINNR